MDSAVTARGNAESIDVEISYLDFPDESYAIPCYLERHYWWAYVRPGAVRFFERQWLANLILWGNYTRLRDEALSSLGERLPGRTVQVACVYGDLTTRLYQKISEAGGKLDVVDVLPVQLANLRKKLGTDALASLMQMDASALCIPDSTYDRAILFFLLHEQPAEYRKRTLAEVMRVVKPGGTIVIVEYARPRWWNPVRYAFGPLLALLEPFALDLWQDEITVWMPESMAGRKIERQSFFGGLYQKLVITR